MSYRSEGRDLFISNIQKLMVEMNFNVIKTIFLCVRGSHFDFHGTKVHMLDVKVHIPWTFVCHRGSNKRVREEGNRRETHIHRIKGSVRASKMDILELVNKLISKINSNPFWSCSSFSKSTFTILIIAHRRSWNCFSRRFLF